MTETRFEVDGQDYCIIDFTADILTNAQKVYNKAFSKALENGALLKKRLYKYMVDQGVWDDDKEAKYQGYIKKIADLEYKLNHGKMKVSEGKKIALELAEVRTDFKELITERNLMDINTAEGQADNARFNFLLSACVLDYVTRKPAFKDVEEYTAKGSEKRSMKIAAKFANVLYGIEEDYEESLVETKFLRRFNLIDKEGRFIDKEGNFIDVDGNRLDAEGFKVNEAGQRLDINGNPIIESDVATAEFEED